MVRYGKEEIAEARARLKKLLRPGDTVYTILRHVSRSGMYRSISVVVCKKGEYLDITYPVSRVLEDRIDKHGGIAVSGCGMDMGFHLIYNLSYCLFPNGFKVTDRHRFKNLLLQSANEKGYREDGGYALQQIWL